MAGSKRPISKFLLQIRTYVHKLKQTINLYINVYIYRWLYTCITSDNASGLNE